MKTILEIAMECDLTYNKVSQNAKKEKLVPACMFGKIKYTKWQVAYLQELFYYEGILPEITLPSCMNLTDLEYWKYLETKNTIV